jgi:hypothetical protein
MFMALESVLLSLVKDMGSPKCIGEFARFLRDHPDHFPMFSTVPDQVPSERDVRRSKTTLRSFIDEKRELGHGASVMFEAFMNMYMQLGSQAIGALNLADHIESWDARQARVMNDRPVESAVAEFLRNALADAALSRGGCVRKLFATLRVRV